MRGRDQEEVALIDQEHLVAENPKSREKPVVTKNQKKIEES